MRNRAIGWETTSLDPRLRAHRAQAILVAMSSITQRGPFKNACPSARRCVRLGPPAVHMLQRSALSRAWHQATSCSRQARVLPRRVGANNQHHTAASRLPPVLAQLQRPSHQPVPARHEPDRAAVSAFLGSNRQGMDAGHSMLMTQLRTRHRDAAITITPRARRSDSLASSGRRRGGRGMRRREFLTLVGGVPRG